MRRIIFLIISFLISISTQAQVVINEISSANGDIQYDREYYNFSSWVELYNGSGSYVNLSGYFLSNDVNDPFKWKFPIGTSIPSKGYLLVWCDEKNKGLHTNFSLDNDGETLILSTPTMSIADQMVFPKQYTNITFGRIGDGKTDWGHLSQPSPSAKNINVAYEGQVEAPLFSLKAGRYQGSQSLTLSHPLNNIKIFYTTDGSEPNTGSYLYMGAISIAKTQTIKAKAYYDKVTPSKTIVNTYFINEHAFTLPVLSISTKPDYLWNNVYGIYTDGTNGKTGNCKVTPVNWNQDWDRHADIEYFNSAGEKQFNKSVDIRIGGGCSRGLPQKSFVVRARDKYGSNFIDEKLFENKESKKYGGFMLRNGGNDFNKLFFRDALMQHVSSRNMDVDYLDYKPVIVFLNGKYWGIQDMREKIDADFIESNYGLKKHEIDLMVKNAEVLEGSNMDYKRYLDSLQLIDRNSPSAYTFIEKRIDVQEFINYWVTEIYFCNTDWPGNNIKFWKPRDPNGKFRWILWDLDFGLGLYTKNSYPTHPTLDFATEPNNTVWPNPSWSTLHFRLLLENPIFRDKFIQTMNTALMTTFKPENLYPFIETFTSKIKEEVPYHKLRWGGSVSDWQLEIQRVHDFIKARHSFLLSYVPEFFSSPKEWASIQAMASPTGAGGFELNGIRSNQDLTNVPYHKNLPFTIIPIAAPGYVFKEWKITKVNSQKIPLVTLGETWKFNDLGSDPGPTWKDIGFDDSSWKAGVAELGYGDGDESTKVNFGNDPNNKYITTYFRKKFILTDTTNLTNLFSKIIFDDGVIVYLNGTEVFRNNLPTGTVGINSPATAIKSSESIFTLFTIHRNFLTIGENILAIEVHQASPQSDDLSFNFETYTVKLGTMANLFTNTLVINDTAFSRIQLEATFEPATPISNIIINEISAKNEWVKDEHGDRDDWVEILNTGSTPLDIGGLYFSDNPIDRNKWKVPIGNNILTLVNPGEYKLLWADEDRFQGPLHMDFKLASDGEFIGLYQIVARDTLTLDALYFPQQYANTSYSRIPNATGDFISSGTMTPGNPNQFQIVTDTEEDIKSLKIYPNPTRDELYIQSPFTVHKVLVIDALGRATESFENTFSKNGEDIYTISIGTLPMGLYIVKIIFSQGTITKPVMVYK